MLSYEKYLTLITKNLVDHQKFLRMEKRLKKIIHKRNSALFTYKTLDRFTIMFCF